MPVSASVEEGLLPLLTASARRAVHVVSVRSTEDLHR
jgi:hypothetical protein